MQQDDIFQLPQQIQDAYNGCSEEEKVILKQILRELGQDGYSPTYENVWLADYKEIPVSIDTFIDSDLYLGKATRQGTSIYPFWRQAMRDIFNAGNKYDEVVFTGATRIGKSSTAITCVAYMLYRLMCLRDPQAYFNKKDVSIFYIYFFNITKDLASGVAYREFHDTLRVSPWFNQHGKFSRSERNFYYIPEGDKVRIDFGSSGVHALGTQLFCLVGSTPILTAHGPICIEDLVGQDVPIAQYNVATQCIEYSNADVVMSGTTNVTSRIFLEDGNYIEGTADHRLLMSDGNYKAIKDIQCGDTIQGYNGLSLVCGTSIELHACAVPVYDVIDIQPHHNFVVCIGEHGVVAHNCAVMDEANFVQAGIKDVQKAKARMMETYNIISARIKGTFRKGGEVYGKLFTVSSKKSDSDFIEDHVQRQLMSGAGDHMYVVDKPQWEILPKSMFHDETFYIAVGDRHMRGFVVPDNQTDEVALSDLRSQGYVLMTPPIDMKPEFIADFDVALRDLAGISVPGALSFISQDSISACLGARRNPFYNDILSIGTRDGLSIQEFFHIEEIPKELKHIPMYIHLDLSLNTDKSGIGAVGITSRKDIEIRVGDTIKTMSMPFFTHVFSVAIQAPRGDKIPYGKIVEFILWLRKQGFNIRVVSRDQFQSEYIGQLLEDQGFSSPKISLDRTPDGYIALRSVLLEKRIDLVKCQLLEDELIHLQRDSVTGKVDHPIGGCFTLDTKIHLSDGRDCTIQELLHEQEHTINHVSTINEVTGNVEIKPIRRVFFTKICEKLIIIRLSNGGCVRCTPEHRFMLPDTSYIEAQHLHAGMQLKSISTVPLTVVSTNIIDIKLPVYDIEVVDNHNFPLSVGVYVHNSKDVSDGLAGCVWQATLDNPVPRIPVKSAVHAFTTINGSNHTYTPADVSSAFQNLYKNRRK